MSNDGINISQAPAGFSRPEVAPKGPPSAGARMGTDKQKLKALAEAQDVKVWSTFFVGHAMRSGQKMFSLNGPSAVSCHEDWGFTLEAAQYIAAACPAAVLALFAEIERLEAQVRLAGVAAEVTVHKEVGRAVTRELALAHERDQLKAENEALRDGANFRAIQSLRADCEALRQDAERYRWLRDQCGLVEYKAIAGSIGPGMLPSGEKLQEAIDAAMAKEASHG